MRNLLKASVLFLLISGINSPVSAQSHIDNNYQFSPGSGTHQLIHTGAGSNEYITISVRNKTVTGRIYKMSKPRMQGHYTGTITNGVIHGTVTWSVVPSDMENVTYFSLYKRKGHNALNMAFYDSAGYKTNNRIRAKYTLSANPEKKVAGTTGSNTNTRKLLPEPASSYVDPIFYSFETNAERKLAIRMLS